MTDKPQPLSVIVNEIRTIIDKRSATDFTVYYDDPTLYGDLQYIRTKARAAWEKKTQESQENQYKHGSDQQITRPDLVEGELEFALNRCKDALQKLEERDDDQYSIEPKLRGYKETIEAHHEAAKNGEVLYQ